MVVKKKPAVKAKATGKRKACGECGKPTKRWSWAYLHSKCHPDSPTWSRYNGKKVEILCAVCEKKVASFNV